MDFSSVREWEPWLLSVPRYTSYCGIEIVACEFVIYCCRCRVKRGSKDGDLVVCPDIICDNPKDAEHLASTLALYHLCRGQVSVNVSVTVYLKT